MNAIEPRNAGVVIVVVQVAAATAAATAARRGEKRSWKPFEKRPGSV